MMSEQMNGARALLHYLNVVVPVAVRGLLFCGRPGIKRNGLWKLPFIVLLLCCSCVSSTQSCKYGYEACNKTRDNDRDDSARAANFLFSLLGTLGPEDIYNFLSFLLLRFSKEQPRATDLAQLC